MKTLMDYSLDELPEILPEEPTYRFLQLYQWMHKHMKPCWQEMKNIPKQLKEKLSDYSLAPEVTVARELKSQDGTIKLLFSLENDFAEAVIMSYSYGTSICLSTQIGCAMGCQFCASTKSGFVRNITSAEMERMFQIANTYSSSRINHIVFMGSGEPMLNLDEVLRFIAHITHPEGYQLSARNITISTCGIPSKIKELADSEIPITLALSLHAPNPLMRKELMPGASKFSLEEILQATDYYIKKTNRRVTVEMALIEGKNDDKKTAQELADLIRGKLYHVNLIPINPIKEKSFGAPSQSKIAAFRNILEVNKIHVTIRRELGSDIAASCGQLRNQVMDETQ